MAIGDAYAKAEEYRAVSKQVQDPAGDLIIVRDLLAVSRWIDTKLGRFFTVDAGDVARIFEPISNRTLAITDLSATPTSIKIDENDDGLFTDETALAATDFELRPLNAAAGPVAEPFTEVVLTRWGTKNSWRNKRVEILGKWGWLAVPDVVVAATIEFTRLWRMESPRATTSITEMDQVVGMSVDGSNILRDLIRTYWKGPGFA